MKLIDTETGQIVWAGSARGSSIGVDFQGVAAEKAVENIVEKQLNVRFRSQIISQDQLSAEEWYNKAIRMKPDYDGTYYNYACLFALQKDATQACNWIESAIERGYKNWKQLKDDKDFDSIRNEKCFGDILNKYAR